MTYDILFYSTTIINNKKLRSYLKILQNTPTQDLYNNLLVFDNDN